MNADNRRYLFKSKKQFSVALCVLCASVLNYCAYAAADWPMFHGDSGLTGFSRSRIPEKPQLLWTAKTGGAVKGSAAISGGRVYVGNEDGTVFAFKLSDGTKIWEFKTEGAIESTPCIAGGSLFIGSNDRNLY